MKFVDLEHPKAGTCRVPETTAENLIRYGGWRRSKLPAPKRTKPAPPASTPDPDIPGDGEEANES